MRVPPPMRSGMTQAAPVACARISSTKPVKRQLRPVLIGFPVHRADENQGRRRIRRRRSEGEIIRIDAGRNGERGRGAEFVAEEFSVAFGNCDDAGRRFAGASFKGAHLRRFARIDALHDAGRRLRVALKNFGFNIMREDEMRGVNPRRRHGERLRVIENDEVGLCVERRRGERPPRRAIGVGMG